MNLEQNPLCLTQFFSIFFIRLLVYTLGYINCWKNTKIVKTNDIENPANAEFFAPEALNIIVINKKKKPQNINEERKHMLK